MDNTRAQQKTLDDELVAPTNRLKMGKSNLRLSSILKSKEPTLQVALHALKLTPFYNAFEISADVPKLYMQEFWMYAQDLPNSLVRLFEETPTKEEILSFIRDLGHTGEIKFLSDVNVNHMHQPWRSFAAIINKCLSGKTTALESLRLSRTPKPKSTKKKVDSESSVKMKLTQASKGKRIKTLATKKSLIQTHNSHASGSGADEGTGSIPGVPDVPTYKSDDEQISWKSSEEEDDEEVNVSKDNDNDADNDDDIDKDDEDDDADNQDDEIPDDANQDDDDDDEQTYSDNDGDDFVHPKLSTHDDEARQDDEVNEEESDEERSNEDSDEEVQGENIEEEEMDE
ncbi:hypothetical protein Tco_0938701 [Tanacetum coccineum]|uniref:Uncharacterized protein n=1 Tax=Tanacetum coccineum TaxID=301880 RepID=A0ABQ5DKN9_9ASTR